jgi:hypothetical protein
MTRLLLVVTALFCLAVPAALAVPPAGQGQGQSGQPAAPSVSELCKQQRRTIGMADFRALHAPTGNPKAAMDACLAKQVQVASTVAKNAAKACKAEQTDVNFAAGHSGKSFAQWYGKNDNGRNAFGKCVSMKAQEAVAASEAATTNAAKKCKAERADTNFAAAHGGKSFAEEYGKNNNKKNAFGKCVSKYAKQQSATS